MFNFRTLEMKIYHFKFIHFLINKCLQLQFHFNFSHSTTSSWYVNNSDPISLPHIHISSSSQIHILNHLQNSRDWKGCKHDERERKFQWGNSAKFNSRTTKSISFHFLSSCLTPHNNFINHFHHLQSQAERWWQRPLNQKGFSHSSSLPLRIFLWL